MMTCLGVHPKSLKSDRLEAGPTQVLGEALRRWLPALAMMIVPMSMVVVGCRDKTSPGAGATSAPASAPDASRAGRPDRLRGEHNGQRLPIDDERGYVEWVLTASSDEAKVYFLDREGHALKGVAEPTLLLKTPAGPRLLVLQDCGDPRFPHACGKTVVDQQAGAQPEGVIRFMIDEQGYRVRLPGTAPPS